MIRFTVAATLLVMSALPLSARSSHANGLVAPVNGAPDLLIPVAGNVPGANGTFFHSDITLVNLADAGQHVELRWLPGGGGAASTTRVELEANGKIRSEDFVAQYFQQEGIGSILVTAVSSSGVVDPTARLYATARIWTQQPGTNGTSSQTVDVVPVSAMPIATSTVFGVRRDTRFRLNAGIVNLDPVHEATFLVGDLYVPPTPVVGELYVVTVPPMSMQQIPLAAQTTARTDIYVRLNSFTPVAWVAYGSSVDNVTGDGWTELALPND
jgi:hypothetical protein